MLHMWRTSYCIHTVQNIENVFYFVKRIFNEDCTYSTLSLRTPSNPNFSQANLNLFQHLILRGFLRYQCRYLELLSRKIYRVAGRLAAGQPHQGRRSGPAGSAHPPQNTARQPAHNKKILITGTLLLTKYVR
jgi:hypothetical protein